MLLADSEKKILKKNLKRDIFQNQPNKKTKRKKHQTTDKNYGADTCEKPDMSPEFLESKMQLKKKKLKENFENRATIEVNTRKQSMTSNWHEIRREMVTASDFGKICKVRSDTSYHSIIKNKLYSAVATKSTIWGDDNEKNAISELQKQLHTIIEDCGLFIDKELHFLGATPDGLISENSICEVKCPQAAVNCSSIKEAIETKKIKYLKYNSNENTIELKTTQLLLPSARTIA
jgi:hypothetical protein